MSLDLEGAALLNEPLAELLEGTDLTATLRAYLRESKSRSLGIYEAKLEEKSTRSFSEHQVAQDGNCGFIALGISREEAVAALLSLEDDPKTRSLLLVEEFMESMDDWKEPAPDNDAKDPLEFVDQRTKEQLTAFYSEYKDLSRSLDEKFQFLKKTIEDKKLPVDNPINQNLIRFIEAKDAPGLGPQINKKWKKELLRDWRKREELIQSLRENNEFYRSYVKSYNMEGKGLWLGLKSMYCIAKAKGLGLYVWSKRGDGSNQLALYSDYILEPKAGRGSVNILQLRGHYNFLVEEGEMQYKKKRKKRKKAMTKKNQSRKKTGKKEPKRKTQEGAQEEENKNQKTPKKRTKRGD